MVITERYQPIAMAANATQTLYGSGLGGFLPVTAGTLTVLDSKGNTIVNAIPVSAGVFLKLPIFTGQGGATNGGSVTLAGGASGTLLVQ